MLSPTCNFRAKLMNFLVYFTTICVLLVYLQGESHGLSVGIYLPTIIVDSDIDTDSLFIYHNGQPKLGNSQSVLEIFDYGTGPYVVPFEFDGWMKNIDTGIVWEVANVQAITHETEKVFMQAASGNPPYYCEHFFGTNFGYHYFVYSWHIPQVNQTWCTFPGQPTPGSWSESTFNGFHQGRYCCGASGPTYRLETSVQFHNSF